MMPSQQIGDITNIYMLRLQVKQSVHPFFMPLHLPPHNWGDTIRYTNTYKCDVEVVPPSMGPYGRQLPLGRHPSTFNSFLESCNYGMGAKGINPSIFWMSTRWTSLWEPWDCLMDMHQKKISSKKNEWMGPCELTVRPSILTLNPKTIVSSAPR